MNTNFHQSYIDQVLLKTYHNIEIWNSTIIFFKCSYTLYTKKKFEDQLNIKQAAAELDQAQHLLKCIPTRSWIASVTYSTIVMTQIIL